MAKVLLPLMLTLVPWAVAQESQANPQVPEDAFTTRQLIAWSGVQKPQPTPQPLPPRDTPMPQPDQPPDQQAKPPGDSQTDQAPAQSFTGKIIKEAGKYSLQVGTKTYDLEQQEGLKKYENQAVRVVGNLDSTGGTIRIVKFELLS